MASYKGFDADRFIEYLYSKIASTDESFSRALIEVIIQRGHEREQIGKDQFCYWIADMIPGIEFCEAAAFMEDDCLTENGQAEKRVGLQMIK